MMCLGRINPPILFWKVVNKKDFCRKFLSLSLLNGFAKELKKDFLKIKQKKVKKSPIKEKFKF